MVYTLWTTDPWLTWTSFRLHGVFSTQAKAVTHAKEENLIEYNCHVVIYKGRLDDYEADAQKVFSTEFDDDRTELMNE